MRSPGPRLAKRITLSLIILSGALAVCAIAFHRLHGMAVDRTLDLLAESVAVQASKTGHWLDARDAAFRLFASQVHAQTALDPGQAAALGDALFSRDEAFTELAVMDDAGRTLWGTSSPGTTHAGFAWFEDAAGPAPYAGGVYTASDGTARVVFSRRLERDGRTWHLRAEADPVGLAPELEENRNAGWMLMAEQGPVMSLAGLPPGSGLALRLKELAAGPLPVSRRSDDSWLIAAARLPGRRTTLGAALAEPVTPYKNTGLALTIMAAVCLAYAGYVRARSLRG